MATYTATLYDGRVEVAFNSGSHRYSVAVDGEKPIKAPSVTTALGVLDKPWMPYWVSGCCADYLIENMKPGEALDEIQIEEFANAMKRNWRNVSNRASGIGSMVHSWIERYLSTPSGEAAPELPHNPEAQRSIRAFLEWLEDHHVEIIASEQILYSLDHGYAGTADLIAKIDGRTVLADFKTSKPTRDGKPYREWALQTAAYRLAWEEGGGDPIEERMVLRLDKDGDGFEVLPITSKYSTDRDTFLRCLGIYRGMRG